MSVSYIKTDCTIVFKTSNRSNSRTKIKTFRNRTIDSILTAKKLPGIPEKAVILEMGFGKRFVADYKKKYKL
jgi:hypothetical protein